RPHHVVEIHFGLYAFVHAEHVAALEGLRGLAEHAGRQPGRPTRVVPYDFDHAAVRGAIVARAERMRDHGCAGGTLAQHGGQAFRGDRLVGERHVPSGHRSRLRPTLFFEALLDLCECDGHGDLLPDGVEGLATAYS